MNNEDEQRMLDMMQRIQDELISIDGKMSDILNRLVSTLPVSSMNVLVVGSSVVASV